MARIRDLNYEASAMMEVSYPPIRSEPYASRSATSRFVCTANVFSGSVLRTLVNRWEDSGRICQVMVETGGGYVVREPDGSPRIGPDGMPLRMRWPERWAPLVMMGNTQPSSAKNDFGVFTSPETLEIAGFLREKLANPMEGDPAPETWQLDPDKLHINTAQVLWRLEHPARGPDGQPIVVDDMMVYRQVPVGPELSHHAEAYQDDRCISQFRLRTFDGKEFPVGSEPAFDAFKLDWRIHLAEYEAKWVNESRKACSAGLLMWRKPGTGSLIQPDENYAGDTLCWHASYGSPCYGPHPNLLEDGPSMQSPGKGRRQAVGSGGGGRPGKAPGRKKTKPDTDRTDQNIAAMANQIGLG